MNALSTGVLNGLHDSFEEADNDDDVLVVVLTGAGGRAFCAGMDLKEMTERDQSGAKATAKDGFGAVGKILKPVIGAVDGFALAGGMQIAARCDFRIATERSIQEPSEEIPFGLPENKHVHYRLMYDLLALAFEGDLTRSATFMLGKDLSGASFPEAGFNGGWHGSSHHGDKPENVANYAKMNRYHVQNLAYFVEKLSKTPDGQGTLLDHVLIYKGSNMGNSHRHAHVKVPVILLGGLDGSLRGNRHIVFPDNTERTSNMLLAMLHRYGIEKFPKYDASGRPVGVIDSFGSSTKPISL